MISTQSSFFFVAGHSVGLRPDLPSADGAFDALAKVDTGAELHNQLVPVPGRISSGYALAWMRRLLSLLPRKLILSWHAMPLTKGNFFILSQIHCEIRNAFCMQKLRGEGGKHHLVSSMAVALFFVVPAACLPIFTQLAVENTIQSQGPKHQQ